MCVLLRVSLLCVLHVCVCVCVPRVLLRGACVTLYPSDVSPLLPVFPRRSGVRALFRKNLSLQKRQKGLCVCTIITPLLVMGLLALFQARARCAFVPLFTPLQSTPLCVTLASLSLSRAQLIVKAEVGNLSYQNVPALVIPLNFNILIHVLLLLLLLVDSSPPAPFLTTCSVVC